jgi:hypothetical protein
LKEANDRLEKLLMEANSVGTTLGTSANSAQRVQQQANDALSGATGAQGKTAEALADAASAQQSAASTAKQAADLVKHAGQLLPQGVDVSSSNPKDSTPLLQDAVPCLMDDGEARFLRTGRPAPQSNPAQTVGDQLANAAAGEIGDTKEVLTRASSSLKAMNLRGLTASQVTSTANFAIAKAVKDVAPDNKQGLVLAQATEVAAPAIAEGVAAVPTTYTRPGNIGCSMSVMPWTEAYKVFGREVADEFLAVQVDVRNMDTDHEFLLHDAEFAVDAYGARLQRFQVGHEKQIVRGVSVWGENYGRHAVGIHIVEGVGVIMGAVVGLPQPPIQNLVNATGAYQAGFVPMVNKLFPNLSTNNLNNLNDFAFSATSNSRIVVPKGGSVPFVLFVPVEPLQQACWLQDSYNFFADVSFVTACDKVCKAGDEKACEGGSSSFKKIKFKHWTPIQLEALQKHSYVAIAGAHFKALAGQPTLKSVACAADTDPNGAYRLASLGGNPLNCTLNGSDLDTMTKLRMRPPNDTADANAVDAGVTVSGDSSTAKATIAAADVLKITKPLYDLFSVDKSGKEGDLKQTLSFLPPPKLDAISSPPKLTDFKAKPTLSLTGSNLQQVAQVILKDTSGSQVAAGDAIQQPPNDGSKLTVNLPTTSLKDSVAYEIWLQLSDSKNTQLDSKQPITFGK